MHSDKPATRTQLAWFSPLPPQPGGVAAYSEALVSRISDQFDVLLINGTVHAKDLPQSLQKFRIIRPDEFRPADYPAILPVYHMGNNVAQCSDTFDWLRKLPGVTILHDLNIHGFLLDRYARGRNHDFGFQPHTPVEENPYYILLQEAYGNRGAEQAIRFLRNKELPDIPAMPCHELVSRPSLAVISHSEWARERLLRDNPQANIFRIPLGLETGAPALASEVKPGLIICAGYLEPTRRLESVIAAIASLRRNRLNLRARFVGSISRDYRTYLTGLAEEYKIAKQIEFTGFVESDDAFDSEISAASIVVHLRHPTMGESSATVLRSMLMQKPVIVSKADAYQEIPDACAWKVDTSSLEVPLLTEYLEALFTRPEISQALAASAFQFATTQHNWKSIVPQFVSILRSLTA
jgi:glycosyltransferase involved in cell wall biosynthesis